MPRKVQREGQGRENRTDEAGQEEKTGAITAKERRLLREPPTDLEVVLDFLDLPEWEPGSRELGDKRNEGRYEEMNPATRRRLEEHFEPHNRRLYEFLGKDFGW